MTTEPQQGAPAPSATSGLVDRVKNILLQPRAEWDRIAPEPANVGGLYMGYVLPLAALAAVAAAIGGVVFGYGGFGFFVRLDPITGVVQAVTQVVFALVGVFFYAFIINALAPNFGSQADQGQAHKLAAYSSTAGFVAGVFALFPPLAPLSILGIYSLVLLYLGLPRLMKTPEDKRVGYFVTIIIVGIVLGLVFSVVMTTIRTALPIGGGAGSWHFGQTQQRRETPAINLPGGGSVNVGDLERAGQQMQQQMQRNASVALDPAAMQALLPESLPGGFTRSSVSSSSGGAAGMNMAQAEAQYARGEDRIDVNIVHMGAMSGLATMGAAMGVQANRQDADGYERTSTADGRTITEEMSRSSQSAKYTVITRTGVAVSAEGHGAVTPDDVRNAVAAIGVERAEALPSAAPPPAQAATAPPPPAMPAPVKP